MSTTSTGPPPPMFMSPGNPPPPGKKLRVGGTPNSETALNDADGTIARRKAELGRLQDLQNKYAPAVSMARDQLGQPPMPPNYRSAPTLPPVQNPFNPGTLRPSNQPVTYLAPNSNVSASTNPGNLSRRLEESFPPNSPPKPPIARQSPSKSLGSPNEVKSDPLRGNTNSSPMPPSAPMSRDRLQSPSGTYTVGTRQNGTIGNISPKEPPTNASPKYTPPLIVSDAHMNNPVNQFANASVVTTELHNKEIVDDSMVQSSTKNKSHVSFHPSVPALKMETSDPESSLSNGTEKAEVTRMSKSNSNAGNTPATKISSTIDETTPDRDFLSYAGHTPFVGKGMSSPDSEQTDGGTPTTTRREMLATMRAYADTPPAKHWDAAESRETSDLKKDASITPYVRFPPSGPTSAIKDTKMVGFLSPVMNVSSPAMGLVMSTPKSISRRCATPYPKLNQDITQQDRHFLEAAEVVPFEYVSAAATFTVRRPFGLAMEQDMWFSAGTLNAKAYGNNADVTKPSTFDVVATINCDHSILVINGDCEVRHKQTFENKWSEFGNIKEEDKVLGFITYIDSHASEKQYSLDDICEGALSVREHYCSSIISTGEAFRIRPIVASNYESVGTDKSPKLDANVGTEDLPAVNAEYEDKKKIAVAPTYEPPTESASDVLSSAVGMFFSTIFGVIWFLLVRIPFMVLTHMIVIVVAVVLLSIIQMYVADDNGAAAMGASIVFMPNGPGVI